MLSPLFLPSALPVSKVLPLGGVGLDVEQLEVRALVLLWLLQQVLLTSHSLLQGEVKGSVQPVPR